MALANGKEYVLVAEGTYIENAVLQEGIELLGGMKEDFSTRNALLYPTILQSQDSSPALQIIDVQTESTVVEGFISKGILQLIRQTFLFPVLLPLLYTSQIATKI